MGFIRSLKSIFDTEILGEETINKQQEVFLGQQKLFPDEDPHFHLAQTWLSRMIAQGNNPNDSDLQSLSFSETFTCACLPPPSCARALGLYILYKERPDIIERHKKFSDEYEQLLGAVLRAIDEGTVDALYRKYNPKMAKAHPSEE